MNSTASASNFSQSRRTLEAAINLALAAILVYWCFLIMRPFINVVIWGAIIAVALYPLYLTLKSWLGQRGKLAATLMTLIVLAVLITPIVLLSESLITSALTWAAELESGAARIPPPSPGVQEWPLVGESLYSAWLLASQNLSAALEQYSSQLEGLRNSLLATAAGVGTGSLQMVFSIIISGLFLANAGPAGQAVRAILKRVTGEQRGERLASMSEATVRSVAQGVLGVALIQAILSAVGLLVAGVPAAGLWTLIILVLAIAQLPPFLVLAPIMVYAFSVMEPFGAVLFMIWSLLVSMSDAVLKPLLLGRGLDVPMLVILIGAIGGMISAGIVGLFVGAVVLVLGYELFELWLRDSTPATNQAQDAAEATD